MRRSIYYFICILLAVGGLAVFLYLYGSSIKAERVVAKGISTFRAYAGEAEVAGEGDKSGNLNALLAEMQAYNQIIYENGQADLVDPFSYEQAVVNLQSFGLDTDILGYMNIPKMGVELPIYLGANKANMAKGTSNLGATSLPVGGENTNAVFAAHRGYSGAAMFRDIELLESGDQVYITNLWETLVYEVTEIKIIQPTDIDEVLIRPGKDMITLITCHPYTKNYQRYAVFCERTVYSEAEAADEAGPMLWNRLADYVWQSESEQLIMVEQVVPPLGIIISVSLLAVIIIKMLQYRKKR